MSEKGSLSVNTEGLLPIIKKWLYTEREVFLREIISNAYDAINKLKHLILIGEHQGPEPSYRIDVIIDDKEKTISVKDNGIGMTYEEIKKYINQIAFSGAKEFVEKYKNIDSSSLVGFFGLGFYSSFIVSKKVEIISKSYKNEEKPVRWVSDGTSTYEMEIIENKVENGTIVKMYIDEENSDLISKEKIKEIIKKYSNFLEIPIYIENEKINYGEPLWAKDINNLKEEDYKKFFNECFGYKEPMFWVHLKTEYPFQLRGIIYFTKTFNNFDIENNIVKLFVKNVFVSDNIKELLPDFFVGIHALIESSDIPLNVSRSQFQSDLRVKKISSYIVKKLGEEITNIYKKDKEKFTKIWEDINIVLKYGAIKDNSFYEKIKDVIIFKTNNDKHTTLKEYTEENNIEKDGKKIILYTDQKNSNLENFILSSGKNVIMINPIIDIHLFNFIETKEENISFIRFDAENNPLLYNQIEIEKEKKEKIIEVFKQYLYNDIEVKNINDKDTPMIVVVDENIKRFNEISKFIIKENSIKNTYKIIINPQSHLITKALILDTTDKDKAKKFIHTLRDISLLSSGMLSQDMVKDFVKRTYDIMNTF